MNNSGLQYSLTREEAAAINCFHHIDPATPQKQIDFMDKLFMEGRGLIWIHSTTSTVWSIADRTPTRIKNFHVGYEGHIPIAWCAYRTWANLFHIRFSKMLEKLYQHTNYPFYHPEIKGRIALMMEDGHKPESLEWAINYLRNGCAENHKQTAEYLFHTEKALAA